MGVDFYTCENCGRTFPDCGPYFSCYSCSARFCSNECGVKQVEDDESEGEPEDGRWKEEITTCIFCRKESVTDRDLMLFLLKKLALSYDEAVELYKKED
jgi:hypothetical protein